MMFLADGSNQYIPLQYVKLQVIIKDLRCVIVVNTLENNHYFHQSHPPLCSVPD